MVVDSLLPGAMVAKRLHGSGGHESGLGGMRLEKTAYYGKKRGSCGARAGQGLRVCFFVDESARRSERPAVRAAERQSAVQKGCRQRQAQRLAPKTQAPASRRARGSGRRGADLVSIPAAAAPTGALSRRGRRSTTCGAPLDPNVRCDRHGQAGVRADTLPPCTSLSLLRERRQEERRRHDKDLLGLPR